MLKHLLSRQLRFFSFVSAICVLSTALISCGQISASTKSGVGASKASLTATAPADLATLLKLNSRLSTDIAGKVHVQLQGVKVVGSDGAIGNVSKPLPGGIDCGSVLVLSSNALSYTNAQIEKCVRT